MFGVLKGFWSSLENYPAFKAPLIHRSGFKQSSKTVPLGKFSGLAPKPYTLFARDSRARSVNKKDVKSATKLTRMQKILPRAFRSPTSSPAIRAFHSNATSSRLWALACNDRVSVDKLGLNPKKIQHEVYHQL